jgi:hypothetical protein
VISGIWNSASPIGSVCTEFFGCHILYLFLVRIHSFGVCNGIASYAKNVLTFVVYPEWKEDSRLSVWQVFWSLCASVQEWICCSYGNWCPLRGNICFWISAYFMPVYEISFLKMAVIGRRFGGDYCLHIQEAVSSGTSVTSPWEFEISSMIFVVDCNAPPRGGPGPPYCEVPGSCGRTPWASVSSQGGPSIAFCTISNLSRYAHQSPLAVIPHHIRDI